jgi:hypothetical protein
MNEFRNIIGSGADPAWNPLYRIGAVAALIVLVFMPVQMAVYIIWPPPDTTMGWFTLFQNNALVGLLDMDLLLIIDYLLLGLAFLALYVALKRVNPSFAAIALMAEMIAVASYLASTAAFEMLSLSNAYTTAATDTEKASLLAAGSVMVATWQGTAFDVSYVLAAIAVLIVSVLMLRSTVFGKTTAYVGLVMGVMALVPPTVGTVGLILSLGSLIPSAVWLALIARRLFQLSRSASENDANQGRSVRQVPLSRPSVSLPG